MLAKSLQFCLIALIMVPSLVLAAGPIDRGGPSFLTGPTNGNPVDIVMAYVEENLASLGLTAADLNGLRVEHYMTQQSGTTHVRLIQRFGDIDVYQGDILANVAADGSIISLHNRFEADLAARAGSTAPNISAVEGVEAAAQHLGLTINEAIVIENQDRDAEMATVLSEGGISRVKIPAQLVWSVDKDATLAWDLSIHENRSDDYWSLRVDASTGEVIEKVNWTVHERFGDSSHQTDGVELAQSLGSASKVSGIDPQYLVYEWPVESPNHVAPGPPADARTLAVVPDDPTSPSPIGWHNDGTTSYTTTQGNNVDAQKNGAEADCGASLDCSFALDLSLDPTVGENIDAAIANLFYWNNIIHDVWHSYGFDEAAGNFQEDNFGNGGAGGDSVTANAQAPGNCNANFSTPSDGGNPTMNMFTCDIASPTRDGDLDNGVIAHEYGHGISIRLTGGPANVSCLNNSEQMGEGWSDWIGLVMTMEPGDAGTDSRGIGTWLLGEGPDGPGVRSYPYSTDMGVNPQTYSDISGAAVPHGVGAIWSAMIWEMTWALIDQHGFNPNIDDVWSAGGNNLAMQLVMDGLKLQPCSPGFVDGRDAILLADQNLTGGANQCLIWEAFAKRGLGFSASQGSSGSTSDGTEAFDTPPFCDFLNPTPVVENVCVGSDAVFSIDVNEAFTPSVTLSASGEPAGSSVGFSSNPVVGPLPETVTMTVSSIDAGAVGAHSITVTGTDSAAVPNVEFTVVDLNVYPNTLAMPALALPANGATNVGPVIELSWSAVVGSAAYLVEVDNDPAFGSVDYSASVNGTVHEVAGNLSGLTTYYWRVTAENLCATGPSSSVYSFTTANITCATYSSTDVPLPIPSSGTSGSMTSTLDIAGSGDIGSLTISLNGTHTWIGDLDFNLSSPAGTSVAFMDTNDCGSDDDFDLTLDDDAAGSFPCPPTDGGTYQPTNPLAAYVAEDINGTWTMTINDTAGGDSGFLNSWSLNICSTSDPVTGPIISVPSPSVSFVQPTDWVRGAALDVNSVGTEDLIWTIAEDAGANCDAPTDIPWLVSMDPAGATNAPGTGESVLMVANSAGLATGQYSAKLCIDSNDPTTPRVIVPVTLDVVEPLFADDLESGDWGAWSDVKN